MNINVPDLMIKIVFVAVVGCVAPVKAVMFFVAPVL